MKHYLLAAVTLICFSQSSHANVIFTYTGSSASEHNCDGVDAQYIEENAQKILDFGRQLNYQTACEQSSYEQNLERETFTKNFNEPRSIAQLPDNVFAEAVLDNTVLALPEIHLLASSNNNQMGIAESFAVQRLLWTGEDTTLSFEGNFDYIATQDEYDEYGYRIKGAYYETVIAASTSLFVSSAENDIFPSNFDEGALLGGSFFSSGQLEGPNVYGYQEGQVKFSFEVRKNTSFYLFGRATALGWNGGILDSRNTLTTKLNVSGVSAVESEQLIAANITQLSPTEVSSPSVSALGLFGFLLLTARRFRNT